MHPAFFWCNFIKCWLTETTFILIKTMNKGKIPIVFNLIIVILLYVPKICFSQPKVNISAGFGVFEFLNAGAKFQWQQFQAGASIGTMPFLKDEKIFSLSGDLCFHFGDTVKYTSTKPWYLKTGISYFSDELPDFKDKFTFLNLRLGRDLNISPKMGIDIELGALIQLRHEKIPDEDRFFDLDLPIWPAAGVSVFFRL